MRVRFSLVLALGCGACAAPTPQPVAGVPEDAPAAGEPARALLHEAALVIAARALGAERVDWPRAEVELAAALAPGAPAGEAWGAVATLVAHLGDPHARFWSADLVRAWREPAAAAPEAASERAPAEDAPRATPPVPREPRGELLPGGVAYVLVPSCDALHVPELQAFARALRGAVLELAVAAPPGWIVDLRFDGGGNVWPMLLGLRPLLGEGELVRSVTADGTVVRSGCAGDMAWLDQGGGLLEQLRIEPVAQEPRVAAPRVAVLVHGWTMSSGEMVACAFESLRAGEARLFGEPTAGLTTATELFPLADGSLLVLPTSRMATLAGRVHEGPIEPDVSVPSADWPSTQDAVVRAALAWLERP